MDRRLTQRIQGVCNDLKAKGQKCESDAVCSALRIAYPEYERKKQRPFRKLIMQELSKLTKGSQPAESTPSAVANGDGEDPGNVKSATVPEAPQKRDAQSMQGDDDNLNSSLRKMYKKSTGEGENGGAAPRKKGKPTDSLRELMGLSSGSKQEFTPEPRPTDRLEDLGGIDGILEDIRQLVAYPLTHPEVFQHLGVRPPTGILLHGPPGSGKTRLAYALAGSLGVPFFKLAATEIVSGMSGESEKKMRELFQAAMEAAPSLLFMDEIDAIARKRESASREMERRIVAQMLTCMDDLQNQDRFVIVLGATNSPESLDSALRRAGRFDRELAMGIPDAAAREKILEVMTKPMRLNESLDLKELARLTPGFVGADLSALTKEAALSAVARAFADLHGGSEKATSTIDIESRPPYTAEEMKSLAVEMLDFHNALKKVQPSALREGFATVPDVTWEDVGALGTLRQELNFAICEPIRKAALFEKMGLTVPIGVLLYGPPGCGKTLLAKAVANASGANFISVKGPELLNKYVGESERAVRLVFQRAKNSSPCVVFFDELDALVPKRSSDGSNASERVVNQMLTELDGMTKRAQVFVIAATNRPDIIDPAMLRPGRLDRLLYVPLPSEQGRLEILQSLTRKQPLGPDVNLAGVASRCKDFSGADLASLAREAAMLTLRTATEAQDTDDMVITADVFDRARQKVGCSVTEKQRQQYKDLNKTLSGQT